MILTEHILEIFHWENDFQSYYESYHEMLSAQTGAANTTWLRDSGKWIAFR